MELKLILESLLFASPKPLTARELRDFLARTAENAEELEARAFQKVKEEDVEDALQQLEFEHESLRRSFRLICIAGAWQFVTNPPFFPWLKELAGEKSRPTRLSHPALETLAIIAYRQPLTRAEMEQVRGVSVDGVLQTLIERGLVEAVGRAEVAGKPTTFGTTHLFLEYFGLRRLEDLPDADELRRIPVKKPEGLLTVEEEEKTSPPAPEASASPEAAAPASAEAPREQPGADAETPDQS